MNNRNINDTFSNETWSTERVKELTMSKIKNSKAVADSGAPRRVRRSFASVAIAGILTLSLTTVALAATGVIDFGAIFNSIFNNPSTEPYVRTGEEVAIQGEGEITIEVLAAFVDVNRDAAYIQLEIHDPMGTKLSDSLAFMNDGVYISAGDVKVSTIDVNTVIASLYVQELEMVDGNVKLKFDTIASGISRVEAQSTGFNIGEHIGMTEPVRIPGAEFIEITGITLSDGLLTISRRNADASVYGWGYVNTGVQTPDGEIIWFSHGSIGAAGQTDNIEIGALDPNDLTLVWRGNRSENAMTGDWEVAVSVENALTPRTIEGTFDAHYTEAIVGGVSIDIRVFGNVRNSDLIPRREYLTPESKLESKYEESEFAGSLEVLLTDGTVILPDFGGYSMGEETSTFMYRTEFINPDEVVSVTFCGVLIDGSIASHMENNQ